MIGKRDIPFPYLNPFDSQCMYQSVDYSLNQYQKLKYINIANMEWRIVNKNMWELNVQRNSEQSDAWEELRGKAFVYTSPNLGTYLSGAGKEEKNASDVVGFSPCFQADAAYYFKQAEAVIEKPAVRLKLLNKIKEPPQRQ